MAFRHSHERSGEENSRERRIADLTILSVVSRALQECREETDALRIILTGLTHGRGLGFTRAFVLLIDPRNEILEGRLAVGPSTLEEARNKWQEMRRKHQTLEEILSEIPGKTHGDIGAQDVAERIRLPLSSRNEGLIRILDSRRGCLAVGGIFQPLGLQLDPWIEETFGPDHFALAPIHNAGRVLGMLIADNSVTRQAIAAEALNLLQIYAQAAGAAIQNIRYCRELVEKIAEGEDANRKLKDSQQHLLQAERLATIGKMAALLAHEIRTPLVSIGGFARRILKRTTDEDPRKEEMQIIVSQVSHLERMVEEVLGFTRISKPDFESVDINELIRSVVLAMSDMMDQNPIRMVLELQPDLPRARVDRVQIRQVLMNLIGNAVEAMPEGGILTITSTGERGYLEIGVFDTGAGIAREHWGKLFSPFFTTKPAGTGLGLAVVSQIIENHGGSLGFESDPGKGTRFHIRLAFEPRQ